MLLAFSLENRPRPSHGARARGVRGHRAFDRAYGPRHGAVGPLPRPAPGLARRRAPGGHDRRADERRGLPGAQRRARRRDDRRPPALRTVIAQRQGTVDERIVVVAHRDAAGLRAEAELSGTAALLELARVFGAPRQTQRTLTLVSTSGGSGGAAGAATLARSCRGRSAPCSCSATSRRATSAPRSSRRGPTRSARRRSGCARPSRRRCGWRRARARAAARAEPVRALRAAGDVRRAGDAARARAAGRPAVDRRRPPAGRRRADLARAPDGVRARRAADRDRARRRRPRASVGAEATTRDLLTSRKVLPGWAVRLFTASLLLAALVAAVDALAALLRRREPVPVWLRWTLVAALPFAVTALFALALGAVGLLGATPGAPVAPQALPVEPPALLAVALVFVLAWVWLRPAALRLLRAEGDPSDPGAARARPRRDRRMRPWLGNPYAAALVAPGAAHLALRARAGPADASGARRRRRLARRAAARARRARARARARARRRRRRLGGAAARAGGHISPLGLLLWSLVAGCGAGALLIAAPGATRRRARWRSPSAARELRRPGLARRHRIGAEAMSRRRARAEAALDGADPLRRPDARRRRADARLAGAGVRALREILQQSKLDDDLHQLEPAQPTDRVLDALRARDRAAADGVPRPPARATLDEATRSGASRSTASADYVLVNGTDAAPLRKGPGFYDDVPFPGAPGTNAIAGHRTTYGAPFASRQAAPRRRDRHHDALRELHVRGRADADRLADDALGHPSRVVTTGSCCRPATRSTARPSGSSSSPASSPPRRAARADPSGAGGSISAVRVWIPGRGLWRPAGRATNAGEPQVRSVPCVRSGLAGRAVRSPSALGDRQATRTLKACQ